MRGLPSAIRSLLPFYAMDLKGDRRSVFPAVNVLYSCTTLKFSSIQDWKKEGLIESLHYFEVHLDTADEAEDYIVNKALLPEDEPEDAPMISPRTIAAARYRLLQELPCPYRGKSCPRIAARCPTNPNAPITSPIWRRSLAKSIIIVVLTP